MANAWLAVLVTFSAALVPILELRAGIPLGLALGLSPVITTVAAVLGNVLQIPLARLLIDRAYGQATRVPLFDRWLKKTEGQVMRYAPFIQRWGWLGLVAFVLLPMLGTGVWGGALLARLLMIPVGSLWLGVGLGVAISGILLTLSIQGAITLIWG